MSDQKEFIFVAMPFKGDHLTEVYEDGIRKAVESCGFGCKRADEIFDTDVIIESIENDLSDCLLVVADLTGRNPNVFYEVGYARALGKEVILLTSASEDVPFDLQHRRYIKYGTSGRELEQMRDTLKKTIEVVARKARKGEVDRRARENSTNVDLEVTALRQQLTTGFSELKADLQAAVQLATEASTDESPMPIMHTARLNAKKSSCQSNLRQLGLGMMQLIQDIKERFPKDSDWQEAILPYVRNADLFSCPGAPNLQNGFAMNAALSDAYLMLLEDPSRTPLLFDSALNQPNASGGFESLCNPPRHLGRNNIVFADGHTASFTLEEAQNLLWNPNQK